MSFRKINYTVKAFSRTSLRISVAAGTIFFSVFLPASTSDIRDAGGMGVFNIGPGEGNTRWVYNEESEKNLLNFVYSIPAGSVIGVWTNDYPSHLDASEANAAMITVIVPESVQADGIVIKMELKGSGDSVQVIGLPVRSGLNTYEEKIDWGLLGEIREAVFVVEPAAGGAVEGTLLFDLEFAQIEEIEARPADTGGLDIFSAGGMGVFNIGPGEGDTGRVYNNELERNLLSFAYSIPVGSVIGVWTNDYPTHLDASEANAARITVIVPESGQADGIMIKMELKGSGESVQVIGLPVRSGLNTYEKIIDWGLLGEIREAVFVIEPAAGGAVEGTVLFDLEFAQIEVLETSPADTGGLDIFSAGGMGVFNIGPGEGDTGRVYNNELERNLLSFVYSIPAGSVLGVWTNDYPSHLDASEANAAKITVIVPESGQADGIVMKMELKGSGESVQVIGLPVRSGLNTYEEKIDWGLLGEIREAVFVVEPAAGGAAEGTVLFDLEFAQIEVLEARPADTGGLDIFSAGGVGVFNIGPSQGHTTRVFSDERNKDVLGFEYSLPAGSAVGVWTNTYPPSLNRKNIDAVRVGVNVPSRDQVSRVLVKLELKGESGVQEMPLELEQGWTFLKSPIYWNNIGRLEEIVFVVKPQMPDVVQAGQFAGAILAGNTALDKVEDTIYFDLGFEKMTLTEKVGGKLWMVISFALVLSLMSSMAHKVFSNGNSRKDTETENV